MSSAPRGMRRVIGLFGRRNVGKSSLVNALSGQKAALVSPVAGTTTDPVERPMELSPLGPVVLVDTAGLDDDGDIGVRRVAASRRVMERCDLAVLVAEAGEWGTAEENWFAEIRALGIPLVVVLNKRDRVPAAPPPAVLAGLPRVEEGEAGEVDAPVSDPAPRAADDESPAVLWTAAAAANGEVEGVRRAIIRVAPAAWIEEIPLARDLLPPGGLAVLVVPIDREAPKGRLILPQVQTLRDLLDGGHRALVVRDLELAAALASLSAPPDLVVTDSQAFAAVAAMVPPTVPLTGFSLLFARAKGDLDLFAAGAARIAALRPGDRVLVAEACTHHAVEDDIGRVKIPRLLEHRAGGRLAFTHVRGRDFPDDPDDLGNYALVIHCGACMSTRREVLSRLARTGRAGTPATNYGVAIAACLGLLDRALSPFPSALAAYRSEIRR